MIVLDFETNTKNPKDILEVGAYKIVKDNQKYKIIDTFHRYYYSKYEVDFFALEVHQLSPEKITQLRKGKTYCKHFEEDNDFINFCQGAKTLIAHNVSFELRYLEDMIFFENYFCTMKENKNIVNALNVKGHIKNPKLIETCFHYNIEFDESQYHNALYDASRALEIINSMNNAENNFDIIQHTLEINIQTLNYDNIKKEADRFKKQNMINQQEVRKENFEKRKIQREKLLENIACPHCSSKHIHKKDKRQRKTFEVQRFQCMDCKKVFQEEIKEESTVIEGKSKNIEASYNVKNQQGMISISKMNHISNVKESEFNLEENKMNLIEKIFNFLGIKNKK